MLGLFGLHVRVQVRYFGFLLGDFSTRVVVEVVNHIFLDLKHVPLHLGVLKLFAQVADTDLELVELHCHVMILRLGLLTLLAFLSLLSFFLASHILL